MQVMQDPASHDAKKPFIRLAPPGGAKFFLGGISKRSSNDSLTAYFRQFGAVHEAVVLQSRSGGGSRGFGFVVYYDVLEIQCSGFYVGFHLIDGKRVEVKHAVPPDQLNELESDGRRLFFFGLDLSIPEEQIPMHFCQYGELVKVSLLQDGKGISKGLGFITFATQGMADACLAAVHEIAGKVVDVKRALPRLTVEDLQAATNRQCAVSAHPYICNPPHPNCKLFVGGLDPSSTDDSLKEHFSRFGQVLDATVMRSSQTDNSRGFGFIVFDNPEAAQVAMEYRHAHEIDGKNVDVKSATPKWAKTNQPTWSASAPPQQQQRQSSPTDSNLGKFELPQAPLPLASMLADKYDPRVLLAILSQRTHTDPLELLALAYGKNVVVAALELSKLPQSTPQVQQRTEPERTTPRHQLPLLQPLQHPPLQQAAQHRPSVVGGTSNPSTPLNGCGVSVPNNLHEDNYLLQEDQQHFQQATDDNDVDNSELLRQLLTTEMAPTIGSSNMSDLKSSYHYSYQQANSSPNYQYSYNNKAAVVSIPLHPLVDVLSCNPVYGNQ